MKKDKIYLAGKVTSDPCYKMKFEAGVKHLEHPWVEAPGHREPCAADRRGHAVAEGHVEVPAADEEVRMGGAAAGLERELGRPDGAPGGESDNEMDC